MVKAKQELLIKKWNLVRMLKILSSKNYFGVVFSLAFSQIMTKPYKLHKDPILLSIYSFILTQQTPVMQLPDGHHHNFEKFNSMRCQFFRILSFTWRTISNRKRVFSTWRNFYLMWLISKEDNDAWRLSVMLHSLTNNTSWKLLSKV